MSRRGLLLGAALLGTLLWSFWLLGQDDGSEVVGAVARPERPPNAAGRAPIAPLALAGRSAADAPDTEAGAVQIAPRPAAPAHARNLFAEYSFEPPKPPALPPAPETPRAPPLPFTYAGRLVIGGTTTYLLARGEETLNLGIGAVVNDFRLVEASPQQLVFLHDPTGQRVTLATSAAPGR